MSDDTSVPKKKKAKLPPLQGETNADETEKKPVRKKKKKPQSAETNGHAPADDETTKVKKESVDGEKPAPRKRKKKPVAESTATKDEEPSSARSVDNRNEDVTGSKASLISKDSKGTGTAKKKVKKKKKTPASTTNTPRDDDNWLTAELATIQEDVVAPEQQKDEDEVGQKPYSTESVVLKSQPLDKLFIETDRGFKRENKTVFAKKWAEEEAIRELEPEKPSNTTIAFALLTHKFFMSVCLFIHGITAGLALWHIVMTYILLYFDNIDFLEHYRVLALPVQCLFYFLLVLCTVSACDRSDIGYPTRRWLLQSLTLQTGTIAVILYLASLICSLCAANLEDKMNLYNTYRNLWTTEQDVPLSSVGGDINRWRDLNTARGILAIVAWIVITIIPTVDRFADNLREGDDDILGDSVELNSKPTA